MKRWYLTIPLKKSCIIQIDHFMSLIYPLPITNRSVIDDSEIVHQTFAIEEVVGCKKKVPGQRSEPWQTMDFIDSISNVDDLSKAFHLHCKSLHIDPILSFQGVS